MDKVELKFTEINEMLPSLLEKLLLGEKHRIENLTKGKIKTIFNKKQPISGVYLMFDQEQNPVYVGRSRNLAQRIGTDHRAI